MTEDKMLIMKSVINAIDPQFIFTWEYNKSKKENDDVMICQYQGHRLGIMYFNEDNTALIVKFGGNPEAEKGFYSHTWNCELSNRNEFDPNFIAANVLRVLAYEALNDMDFSVSEPHDWKSTLIKEFFHWMCVLVLVGGASFALWTLVAGVLSSSRSMSTFGDKHAKTTENPGDTKGNVEVHP